MKATTKRRTSNATTRKSRKPANTASILSSSKGDRINATNEHNGDSSDDTDALLADKGGVSFLESGGDNNSENGDVVHDEQPELKSATDRVFEGEGLKLSPEFEEKYRSNFGKTHKAEANGQLNLLECEEDNNEPPDPDDYVNVEDFKKDWNAWSAIQLDECEEELFHITAEEIWEQSKANQPQLNGITSKCEFSRDAQELELDLSLPASSLDSNSVNSLNGTNIVSQFSNLDIPEYQFTVISAASQESQDNTMSAAFLHHASPSALMENALEPTILETAFPQFSQQLNNSDPNSQLLRTSLDFSLAQNDQEAIAFTSLESLKAFPTSGIYANGNLLAADTLMPPGIGKDCFSLPSPGALSHNGKGRPPGICKLDRQLKELGLIAPGEVAAPEFLESGYNLPAGFSNPAETRTALELAQDDKLELPAETKSTAIAAAPSEIAWIGESQPSPSDELSTLVELSTELNLGSLNKEELLNKAIGQHQAIGNIERQEFNLALVKLHRVRLAGLYFQEFKRRCGHGEFESSLIAANIKTRTVQDYMSIAKHWDLVEAKARSIADLEQYCHLGLNWGLETIRQEKKLLKSAAVPQSDSLLNQEVANCQLPLTANSQQITQFTNIKQEERATSKRLGLSNGTTILPDLRDSDRAISEACDPNTVPEVLSFEQEIAENETNGTIDVEPVGVNSTILNDYMIAVTSNASKFANHQSGHIIKSLLKVNFSSRVKEVVARLSEQEIKAMVMICDEELDNRSE